MAYVSMKQLIDNAVTGQYMVPAFNVFNMDTLTAVLQGAQLENAPVIVQVSMGARKYLADIPAFVQLIKTMAGNIPVPVALNHDHCPSLEAALDAVNWGFSGVMFDGSHLPYEENVRITRKLVEAAHKSGVCVEAELGQLPGFEDMVFSGHAQFTDPENAAQFIGDTGCDTLAVSVGTAHGGVVADCGLPVAFDVLKKIHEVLPGYPLVLHGAASLPEVLVNGVNSYGGNVPQLRMCCESDIANCAQYGICKANMDVDNFLCYTREIRHFLTDSPDKYDPRLYLRPARDAFRDEVRHKIRHVARCAGKNWL